MNIEVIYRGLENGDMVISFRYGEIFSFVEDGKEDGKVVSVDMEDYEVPQRITMKGHVSNGTKVVIRIS